MIHPWGDSRPYNSYAAYFRQLFGSRVQKVAVNAGVKSVGCLWGFGGEEQVGCADYVIEKPTDLIKILAK